MDRYSQNDIERGYLKTRRLGPSSFLRLLESIDVPKLLNHLWLMEWHRTVNIRGEKQYYIKCPFHTERSASCCIHPSRWYFYCFWCHDKGDLVKLVSRVEGKWNIHAIGIIREVSGITGLKYETVKTPIEQVLKDAEEAVRIIIHEWWEVRNDRTYYEEVLWFICSNNPFDESSYLRDFLIHNKLECLYAISQWYGFWKSPHKSRLRMEFFEYLDNRRQWEDSEWFLDDNLEN
jgi:hypothetical protein